VGNIGDSAKTVGDTKPDTDTHRYRYLDSYGNSNSYCYR